MGTPTATLRPLPPLSPTPAPTPETQPPTRQALFASPETTMFSADSLHRAEESLRVMGFCVTVTAPGTWHIRWPGSALAVWRYSPAELCHFAQHHARRYADAAVQSAQAARPKR